MRTKKSSVTTSELEGHIIPGQQRPIRYQLLVIPTQYTCGVFTESKCIRLGLFSCYCCNNYRKDKLLFLKGRKQDEVNAKKYGCRRKEKINVKVIWSARNYNKVTKNKISGATNCSLDDSPEKNTTEL